MNKNLKTILSIMLLAGSISVTSCKQAVDAVVDDVFVSSMSLKNDAMTLFVGETRGIEVYALPRQEKKATYKYETSDKKVATVDKNGVVTAKGAGKANITISTQDGSVSKVCPIYVTESGMKNSAASKISKAIKSAQEDMDAVNKVFISEKSWSTDYKDGKIQKSSYSDTSMTISVDDAFFAIKGTDQDVRVEDGATRITDYSWVFYTNKDFDTYIFHTSGELKTYMVVSTTSFMEKGKRIDAVYKVLDSVFTSGHSIVTSQLEYSFGEKDLGNLKNADKIGSYSNDSIMFEFTNAFNSSISNEEESDYDIPAGTPIDYAETVRVTFDKNLCVNRDIKTSMKFELNGSQCDNLFDIMYDIRSENVELDYPDINSGYKKVEDIFTL